MEYDHKTEVDSEEEDDEGREGGAEEDEGQDQNFVVRKEPSIKRQKMDNEGDRPFKCEVCSLAFKEVSRVASHTVPLPESVLV